MKVNLGSEVKSRIEMLPLIDIVFLLLVFFIYIMLSMAVHRGLSVELPTSTTAQIDKKLTLSVTIDQDGRIYLDKHPVALENLKEMLQRAAKANADTGVLLFAERSLAYQRLFQVLDQIRSAGLSRISLQAEADDLP